MNVVLLAATDGVGRLVLHELLTRGHQVTAVARHPGKLATSVRWVRDDLGSVDRIAEIIHGADAVVSAFGPSKDNSRFFSDVRYTDQLVEVVSRAIKAVRKSRVARLVVVGGCGSLWYSPGVTVLTSGQWPENLVPIATSHMKTLAALRASDINWTYFSPPMDIAPGTRTGIFRLGSDDLIVDAGGRSRISTQDYAQALVDELEEPAHEYARFTIGY